MLLLIVIRKAKALHRATFRKMARLAAQPPGSLRVTSQVSSSRRPLDPPDIGSFTIEPRLSHGRGALEESGMNRLTLEERRRVYLAQRRAQERMRSEEHTSELQSHSDLVCRLLLEKKKKKTKTRRQTQRCLR